MKDFVKGTMKGTLKTMTIDHCIKKSGKIRWTTRQVLMLVDSAGFVLCSAQFRTNAVKKAEKFLIDLGWSVAE